MKDWANFWKAALIRGIRTFAEAMLAYIGTGAVVLGDVNWIAALSAGAMGFITALLLALATDLPEVKGLELTQEEINDNSPYGEDKKE